MGGHEHADDYMRYLQMVLANPVPDDPHLSELVTLRSFAEAIGAAMGTVQSYHSRGLLPPSVGSLDGKPVWTRNQLHTWVTTRPGQGWRKGATDGQDTARPEG